VKAVGRVVERLFGRDQRMRRGWIPRGVASAVPGTVLRSPYSPGARGKVPAYAASAAARQPEDLVDIGHVVRPATRVRARLTAGVSRIQRPIRRGSPKGSSSGEGQRLNTSSAPPPRTMITSSAPRAVRRN